MIVSEIELSWFRGAAAKASLRTVDRSLAVYGANGSGKSCFVDAIEYVLNEGRIRHLAHEYSGKHQEKAVLNTHRPTDANAEISIKLVDGATIAVTIESSGSYQIELNGDAGFLELDCARTVLRQDEVSEFIHSTKGQKYSVLLPLLGLGHLETAAENFRQLGRAVAKQTGSRDAATALRSARGQFDRVYGDERPASALAALRELCDRFVNSGHEHEAEACARMIHDSLEERLGDASAMERQKLALKNLASMDIRASVAATRAASNALAEVADKAVQSQLNVLRATKEHLPTLPEDGKVLCPSCGSEVDSSDFRSHVEKELRRLELALDRSAEYRRSIRDVRQLANRVVSACESEEIQGWASASRDPRIKALLDRGKTIDVSGEAVTEKELTAFHEVLGAAVDAAAAGASFLPPAATELANAKEQLLAASNLLEAEEKVRDAKRGVWLTEEVKATEQAIRDEINERSTIIIEEISADIQRMWAILHPGEPIEDVRLHIPVGTDKAIDVALKFYGKELESPRLTLSEGYRNSLGLCVFLAMAARSGNGEAPIVLDDVIVSLDRGHRGMVVDLLRAEFSNRQVLLFTHDRDWYADLRQQLSGKEWAFRALLPFQNPEVGIRWSHRTGTMDDAKAYVESRADTAANEARKAMDVELAMHAERLSVRLPFARGARNDRRTSHEFLGALISEAEKRFQMKGADGEYTRYDEAIAAFRAADELLMTWANRGSHSEDVTRGEAVRLIDVCAEALDKFQCDSCGRLVSHAETRGGRLQCECSSLRWR